MPVDLVEAALQEVHSNQPPSGVTRCVVALINVANRDHLEVITRYAEHEADVHITLQRATADGIRSWVVDNDKLSAFNSSDTRRRLHAITGGWPILLNQAAELAAGGLSGPEICRALQDFLSAPANAREFLTAVALTTPALHAVLDGLAELDEPLPEDDLIDILTDTHFDAAAALGNLRHRAALAETPGTTDLALESVIATAWRVAGLR